MRNTLVILFLVMTTGLAGCASSLTGESYSRAEARTVQQVEYGRIEALRPVRIEGTKTPVGAAAGTAVGGIAGSGIGGGRGSYVPGKDNPYIFGLKKDYLNDTWVAIDYEGNRLTTPPRLRRDKIAWQAGVSGVPNGSSVTDFGI